MYSYAMKLSIIIVSWKSKDLLKKCVKSIFAHVCDVQYEIIVIDNASDDGTAQMLREMTRSFALLRMTVNRENLGFAKANNQGIREAKGDYVLLLNPDTEFIDDSFLSAVAKMESDERIGVLGCKLLNSDKTLQPSVRAFPRVIDVLVILLKLHKLFPGLLDKYLARDFDYSKEQEVDQVMGAFFLVRRNVFNQIGLLDEKFFIWFEEVDFCRRTIQNGFKVLYYPESRVVHDKAQSFIKQDTLKKQIWFFKSALIYFMK